MKYLPIFAIFFSLSQLSQAQDTLWISEDADIVSRKQAAYFRILSEGPPWTIEEYHYPSQLPKRTGSYPSEETREQDTLWSGLWTFYTEEGILSRKTEYLDGLKEGTDSSWYENGILASSQSYEKDKLRGRFQEWGKEGQLSELRNYNAEGNMIDTWELYHENGEVSRRVDFSTSDTLVNWYYANGQIKMSGRRLEGRLIVENAFAPNGNQQVAEGNGFFEDIKVGRVIEAGNLKNGLRQGKWTKYRTNGTRIMVIKYIQGRSNTAIFYDAADKKLSGFTIPELYQKDDYNPYSHLNFLNTEIEPRPINIEELKKEIGYPAKARDAGIEGQLIVRVLMDQNGEMIRMKFARHGHPILESAIESKMDQIRFTPAIQNHEVIKFWINIPFNFRLLN